MYIHRVRVTDVRAFTGSKVVDIDLSRGTDTYEGWTVLAGRNGSGKTTLLRAMALALAGPETSNQLVEGFGDWISFDRETAIVELDLVRDGSEQYLGYGKPAAKRFRTRLEWKREAGGAPRPQAVWRSGGVGGGGGKFAERSLWSTDPKGWLAAGYGPFRRLSGFSSEVARLMAAPYPLSRFITLFREEASLAEGVQWLQQINYRSSTDRAGYAELEDQVIGVLNHGLFPDDYVVDRVDPDGLWLSRGGEALLVQEMSDGYRTVAGLVTDLIRQIYDCAGSLEWDARSTAILNTGIVLVDEVDVHLHVSWQKRIGPWLKQHFPRIQFIVSTHSPYVCQAADDEGLIRLPGPGDDTRPQVVSTDLYERVIYGTGEDAVLSELFGLDSPYSDEADKLRHQLAALERSVVFGEASKAQSRRYAELVERIRPSPLSRTQDFADMVHRDSTPSS